MKLWLDDYREAPEGWRWVKTARQAITVLAKGEVTHVSLDHDLGPKEKVGDGYEVAVFIEAAAYKKTIPPMEMVVHTQNSSRGDMMMSALRNAIKFWDDKGTVVRIPYQKA